MLRMLEPKNYYTSVKLESKKQAKKQVTARVGEREFSIERLDSRIQPRPTLPFEILILSTIYQSRGAAAP